MYVNTILIHCLFNTCIVILFYQELGPEEHLVDAAAEAGHGQHLLRRKRTDNDSDSGTDSLASRQSRFTELLV